MHKRVYLTTSYSWGHNTSFGTFKLMRHLKRNHPDIAAIVKKKGEAKGNQDKPLISKTQIKVETFSVAINLFCLLSGKFKIQLILMVVKDSDPLVFFA